MLRREGRGGTNTGVPDPEFQGMPPLPGARSVERPEHGTPWRLLARGKTREADGRSEHPPDHVVVGAV